MAVLPFPFLITPMITIFKVPDSASGPQVKVAVGVVLPPMIAAYSVVGERDQGTLEPVLTAPVRASELLLGKAIAASLPSVRLALALLAIDTAGWRVASRLFDPERLIAGRRDRGAHAETT